jgi:hypothetical protein
MTVVTHPRENNPTTYQRETNPATYQRENNPVTHPREIKEETLQFRVLESSEKQSPGLLGLAAPYCSSSL